MAGTSLATWHYDVDCLLLGHFGEGTFASPRHLDPVRMHLVTRIQTNVETSEGSEVKRKVS